MTLTIPTWVLWLFGIPLGILLFWFIFLGVCFWWAFLRDGR